MKKHIAFMLASSLLFAAVLPAVPASAAGTANPAPNVIPAVTEWTGSEGKFTPKDGARIILSEGAELSEAKKDIIRGYFDDMLFISVDFASGPARTGDIVLAHSSDTSLGGEGYTMDATETNVTISGASEISLLYGVITLIQSCYHDGYMPCGHVRDVPQYGLRSGMIDVARTWIPLDYVEEITKYFAWFKLNEIHLHINDNSSDGNGYFRLES
ncbi:MAG: beta-N-acetylhexosaminidase, partial [Clostridia bacterium]|nr:beta-N-acetylhexosaminidase [Clostridia bacterium]